MSTVSIPKKELKTIVKESIREILEQELIKFRALFVLEASKKEQQDIVKCYGKPSRKIAKSLEIKI